MNNEAKDTVEQLCGVRVRATNESCVVVTCKCLMQQIICIGILIGLNISRSAILTSPQLSALPW